MTLLSLPTGRVFAASLLALCPVLVLTQQTRAQNPVSGGVSGLVKGPKGQAIPDALVTLVESEGSAYTTTTGPNGAFTRALLMPGKYKVIVSRTPFGTDGSSAVVESGKTFPLPYPNVLTVGLTTVTGNFVGLDNKPIRGATVRVIEAGDPPPFGMTAADGTFRIPYIKPGVYTINALEPNINCRITIDQTGPPEAQVKNCGRGPAGRTPPIRPMAGYTLDRVTRVANTGPQPPARFSFVHFPVADYSRDDTFASGLFFPPRFNSLAFGGVQVKGQILGPSSTPLGSVSITIGDEDNKNFYSGATNSDGEFTLGDIPPGNYTVEAAKDGYLSRTTTLNISSGATAPPELLMTLDSLPQQAVSRPAFPLTPSADRPILVHVYDLGRNSNFGEQQLSALPLGGTSDMRTFDELSLLVPGVAPPPYTPGVRGPGVGFGVGTAGKFSVNGMRARSNNFTVDGSDNNDPDVGVRRQGFIALAPQSIESITQLQIVTLLWDAELGRNFGSQVNALTKRGGRSLHGQAYGFFTDSSLNARTFFDYNTGGSGAKNPFTRTQAGLVLGGPMDRDRTHFFSSYEHLAVNTATEQHFVTPITDARRFLGKVQLGILNPLPEAAPDLFFESRQGRSPLGSNILSFYPAPNDPGGPFGSNTYTEISPASGAGNIASIKITRSAAENAVLNARYNFTQDDRVLPSANRAISSRLDVDTRTQNLSLIYEDQLGSSLTGQFRFSYGRTRLHFLPRTDSPLMFSQSSIVPVGALGSPQGSLFASQTGPIGEVMIEPYSPVGVDTSTFPQTWVDNTFQYGSALYKTLQRHTFKLGADIRRVQINSRLERDYRPRVVYGNAVLVSGSIDLTGDPRDPAPFAPFPNGAQELISGLELANLGLPSSIFQTLTSGTPDPTIGLRFTEYDLFFNDNWHVTRSLTFDYGLHYNYISVPREVNGRIESALRLEGLPAAGQSRADSPQRTQAFQAAVSAYQRVLDGRTRIYDPDRNNFGPHVGVVWAPGLNSKRVEFSVRAGYGIYYDTILGAVVSQSRNIFPNEIPININPEFGGFDVFNLRNPALIKVGTNGRGQDISIIAHDNQLGGGREDFVALVGEIFLRNAQKGGLAFTLPAKNLRTPYAQQWHVTLDFQPGTNTVISVAYVGTKGTKLTRLTTPNFGPNITTFVPTATQGSLLGGPLFPLRKLGLPPVLVLAKEAQSKIASRPEPALGAYQIFENSASSNYSALQLEARGRFFTDFSFTGAYTWSHAIDDVSDIFPLGGASVLAQDSRNYRTERGDASYDVRHRFSASLIWDLPFYRFAADGKSRWLAGWQIASIFHANTGQPFTLRVPIDANLDGNLTDRPSTTDGLAFFHGHGPSRVAVSPGHETADFFRFGENGIVGRNTLRGDSFINCDLAINKIFSFSPPYKLELRTEFFNLANRANFGLPIRTIGAPGFGSAVDTVNPARMIQFALKFSF
ncbi:MAG: carboxypeptidase-like regulatory domain-containing protein [Blastocatellia bacterium]